MQNQTKQKLDILFIDIETAPNKGYTWGKYEQDVIEFEKEWYILSFTAKWLGSNKIETFGLIDFKEYSKDPECDKELCKKLWEYMDQADIVIGHNSDKFDLKKINARLVINGLTPPSPYKTIDTIKIAKKYFGFTSNKLNDLASVLGVGAKVDTGGFSLWKECMRGNPTAWNKMKKYNKQDVVLLEKVYLRLRPWIQNGLNLGVLEQRPSCNVCGSCNIQKRGFNYSKTRMYQRYQCKDCSGWSQDTKSI